MTGGDVLAQMQRAAEQNGDAWDGIVMGPARWEEFTVFSASKQGDKVRMPMLCWRVRSENVDEAGRHHSGAVIIACTDESLTRLAATLSRTALAMKFGVPRKEELVKDEGSQDERSRN